MASIINYTYKCLLGDRAKFNWGCSKIEFYYVPIHTFFTIYAKKEPARVISRQSSYTYVIRI